MNELSSMITGDPCCETAPPCAVDVRKEVRYCAVIDQLVEKKLRIEADLAKVSDALAALQNDPKLADALTKIGKAMQVRY